MTKGQAHRLRKSIRTHNVRTSSLYMEMADAPDGIQQEFLHTITNPLTRRYVAARLEDAAMDLALTRLDELDPFPYEHVHEGCSLHEARITHPHAPEHDKFRPRLGYIQNQDMYQE